MSERLSNLIKVTQLVICRSRKWAHISDFNLLFHVWFYIASKEGSGRKLGVEALLHKELVWERKMWLVKICSITVEPSDSLNPFARLTIKVGNGGPPTQWHSALGSLKTLDNLISLCLLLSLSPSLSGGSFFDANLENEGSISGSDSTFYRQSEGKFA